MPSLKEYLGAGERRRAVIDDACRVLDEEVAEKSGLTGVLIKGAYKVVQGIGPHFIRDVIDHLMDNFIEALDPLYQEAIAKNTPPGSYLVQNSSRVADALLAVTDQRAERAERVTIKKAYAQLRPSAKKHVEAAAPRLAKMLERHTPPAC